ncbi:MAG: methyltransferase domain-containing protein [Deltaproteobacteria bacterium]|nr:methyltransferase domain-containing protein [Deltaproteobacteria bacterium]
MTTWKQQAVEQFNRVMCPSGFEIARKVVDVPGQYLENPEVGSKNFSEKLARIRRGEVFEWPNMVALNRALIPFIAPAKRIVNIGAGTGTFEWFASEDPEIEFVASEFDRECVRWCRENRQRKNITYCSDTIGDLLANRDRFDLAVSVDVIEHVSDYAEFLREFSQLADRAIVTTPNKGRRHASLTAMPPAYEQHVREWTAGEFYWVLRSFYAEVQLYAMPDVYTPVTREIGPLSTLTPLIAVCSRASPNYS